MPTHVSAWLESSHLGKLKTASGTSSGLEAYSQFFFWWLLLLYRVQGSWEVEGMQNQQLDSLICHACHAFLGLLSAQACSLFNCEIGIAREMLHFSLPRLLSWWSTRKGGLCLEPAKNMAGDKHFWHVTVGQIYLVLSNLGSLQPHIPSSSHTHINNVFKDTVNIIAGSIWIGKIH